MTGPEPDFMSWIEIVDNVPHLKKDAPENIRHEFEGYQRAQEEEEPIPEENL